MAIAGDAPHVVMVVGDPGAGGKMVGNRERGGAKIFRVIQAIL